jgi:ribonucleotide reductase alpha subunit
MNYERQFSGEPITWEKRTAEIKQGDKVIFRQENVLAPSSWSQMAVNIAASKYFYGAIGTPDRETSIQQLVSRVADTISQWGVEDGYFENSTEFCDDLTWLLLHQYCAFNSPVWFNVGLYQKYGVIGEPCNWYWNKESQQVEPCQNPFEYPQGSACFIQGVEDNMDSIMGLAQTDAMLFKFGSGTGTNLSPLRATCEGISGGGHSSGPLSFMRIYDQVAEVVTSAGRTRRAALLHCLNIDHPDIDKFISCKAEEEAHARLLIASGVTPERAAKSVMYQNMNISIQISDEFMQAVKNDTEWVTKWVTTGQNGPVFKARDLWKKIAESTWLCGDPGVQYSTTINNYNTVPHVGRINSSNPCCFTGDTEIITNEGKLTFNQLVKKRANNIKVFSYDLDTNLPVLKTIKRIWRSGYTQNLIKVTTNKGIVVTCTPEHLFYTRQGDTLEAKYLRPGHRLKKLSIKENPRRRGVLMLNHKCTKQHPNGCQYLHRFVYEQTTGTTVSNDYHVHHIDESLENYSFSNLQLKSKFLHLSGHSKGKNNPRYLNVEPEALVEFYETIEDMYGYVSAALWNKYIKLWKLSNILPTANCKSIQGQSWSELCQWVNENRDLTNDVVENVDFIHLEKRVPVYDMEVEGTHNFVVSSSGNRHGLVVHNSEFLAPNGSACNLASINLLKFLKNGQFDYDTFQKVVRILIIAQDILVDQASYPLEEIARNAHTCRQLGLGFTNLGALLMSMGLPYDSDESRQLCSKITSTLTARAYLTSAEIAKELGAFEAYDKVSMGKVLKKHAAANPQTIGTDNLWQEVLVCKSFRNSQVTLCAPTGTISFLMDCDTTGIEPELALVKTKTLVGGGTLKLVNQSVEAGLRSLGISEQLQTSILSRLETTETLIGDPYLTNSELKVFATSLGDNQIPWQAHLKMMAAAQPFLSGGISKTINMPTDSTIDDIQEAYMLGWKLGLKSMAIYRDGSKGYQPLNIKKELLPTSIRNRLPDTRESITHKFTIDGHKGYFTVGLYPDGKPGEIFISVAKEGSTLGGIFDCFGLATSIGLQYGVPLSEFIDKFTHVRFEPMGFTKNKDIKIAKSIVDYIFRWLANHFTTNIPVDVNSPSVGTLDAPICDNCGQLCVRVGSCYLCYGCGSSGGCS